MSEQRPISEADVRAALAGVSYPGLNRDIVSFGMVRSVAVREGRVHVSLVLAGGRPEVEDALRSSIRERLAGIGAVRTEVQIRPPERSAPGTTDPWRDRARLQGVKRIIAVGSGKGGVGKSTVAANLALAFRRLGLRSGLLDADIYGPSVPMIMGIEDGAHQVEMTPDRKILPLEAHGVAVVSFGFFLGPESPAVWRGPMVSKAVRQFSRGVVWPDLDVLVVDLPPGTGDVPLSLAQSVVVDGGIVVTTPQRLAVQEAEKAVTMFRKLDVPVFGIVENMSYSQCECGRRSHPFGRGGGAELARGAGVALLAELPFEPGVVEGEDRGAPPVLDAPQGAMAEAVCAMSESMVAELGFRQLAAVQDEAG